MAPSLLWKHFVRSGTEEKAKCSYCSSDLATVGGNTSSLKKHLQSKHAAKFKELLEEEAERDKEIEESNTNKKRRRM